MRPRSSVASALLLLLVGLATAVPLFDDGNYRPAREGDSLDNVGCVFFNDPDGNRWCVQQIPARA